MASSKNCEICGKDSEYVYPFRYPNINNIDTTKHICYECHESIRATINQIVETIKSFDTKQESTYPIRYPNTNNTDTTKYISYDDYKHIQDLINNYVESGGTNI